MPTVRGRFVNAASSAGGNGTTNATAGANRAYASMAAAVSAEAADLVAADVILDIQGEGSTEDTGGDPQVTGYVTDATRYIVLRAIGANRHPGYWSSSKYHLRVDYGLRIDEPNVYVLGLQLQQNADDNNVRGIYFSNGAASVGCFVGYNIIKGPGGGRTFGDTAHAIFGGTDVDGSNYIFNNLIYDWNFRAAATDVCGIKVVNHVSGKTYVYNNHFINVTGTGAKAVKDGFGDMIAKNNLFSGCTTDTDAGGSGTNYNASTNAGLSGANSRSSQTFTFVDAAGTRNYQLTAADAGARGFGVDLSADANLAFDDDIAGATRPAAWDIGAWNAVVSGGGGVKFPFAALFGG